ncbi:hypothetical protein [Roseovarius sp. MMSF_3281]|uniref:hypothetical protein n=1 Tax=Roseovarius sp. MMSF_3281 TaxID=3046694 RepID=UPI00274026F1|nr:hypothetical protein [Roseovarius sp. MMSF_3281]
MKILKYAGLLIAISCLALLGYGGMGCWAALPDAEVLGARTDELISGRRGGDSLGVHHRDILIAVEGPIAARHYHRSTERRHEPATHKVRITRHDTINRW